MNPKTAIEVLDTMLTPDPQFSPELRKAAVELGIEALKRCQEARKKVYFTTRSLLPGETKATTIRDKGYYRKS